MPSTFSHRHCAKKLAFLFVMVVCCQANLRAQTTDPLQDGDDLFLSKPTTPMRQVRGAILAERLERPDLAQGYLNDLLNSQPSTQTLLDLRTEFGIGTFLKLSSTVELQPASRELLKLINEATVQEAPSAGTVELLIQEFGLSSRQTTAAALKILSAEDTAVVPLLNADKATPQGRIADLMLNKYARRFRYGLMAALPDSDDNQKLRILELLSTTADPHFTVDLARYRFSDSTPVAAAATAATNRLAPGQTQPQTPEDAVDVLIQSALKLIANAEGRYPTSKQKIEDRNLQRYLKSSDDSIPFGPASLARATSLTGDAVAILPNNARCIAALRVAEITEQSWPARWPDSLVAPSVDSEIEVPMPEAASLYAMQMALECNSSTAMLALLQADDAVAVFTHHPDVRRSYLLASDPRVKLLSAVVAKASGDNGLFVKNAIRSASNGAELPEAVVIDSRTSESPSVSAVLATSRIDATATRIRVRSGELATDADVAAELGVSTDDLQNFRTDKESDFNRHYASIPTNTGRSGFVRATEQLYCELILVHSNCLVWNLSDTIANLRSDYRTRTTPIIIYGPQRDEIATDSIRSQHDGIWFLPEPMSEFTFIDRMLYNEIPGPLLTAAERKKMITFARLQR